MPPGYDRHRMSVYVRLALICCLPISLFAQTPATNSISGRVVDSSTGLPVPGVSVRQHAVHRPPADIHAVRSGPDGTFQFESVPVGSYVITVSAQNLGFAEDPRSSDAPPVTVDAAEPTTGLLVLVAPLPSITGKVVDENGAPVAGIHVHALILDPVFTPPRLQVARQSAVTDHAGRYSLSKLAAGAYYVLAIPDSGPKRNRKDGYRPIPTFSPDAPDLSSALSVYVQPGQDANAEIRIRAAATHRIEGKIVQTAASLHASSLQLELFPVGQRQIDVLRRSIAVRPDGTFSIEGVPTGRYEIRLSTIRDGHHLLFGRNEVEVGSTDITGLMVGDMPSITVTALVRADNNNPTAISRAWFRLVPPGDGVSYADSVRSNGIAKIEPVNPDRYLFQVFPNQLGWYVSSVECNGEDVLNKYVEVTPYSNLQVTVMLRSDPGAITGVARDADFVVLAPETPSPDGSDIRHQAVQSDGSFEFRNLPPGEYFLYAAKGVGSQLWLQPGFLRSLNDLATELHIRANETASIPSVPPIERSVLRARAMSAGFYLE